MNGLQVTFTADTGASRTIVSTRVFKQIAPQVCPVIEKTDSLVGAGGAPIRDAGQARMDICLGPLHITKDIMVADIEDDALLGYDILKSHSGKPADILLSSNKIILDNVEIPVFQVGVNNETRQVMFTEKVSTSGSKAAVGACDERPTTQVGVAETGEKIASVRVRDESKTETIRKVKVTTINRDDKAQVICQQVREKRKAASKRLTPRVSVEGRSFAQKRSLIKAPIRHYRLYIFAGRSRSTHHNKLKPYRGNSAPKWAKALAKKLVHTHRQ